MQSKRLCSDVCLAVILFLTTTAFAHASGWSLVFEDSFSGKELDRVKWATRYIYNDEKLDRLNDEIQRYRDNNNHLIKDGVIELIARQNGKDSFESGMLRSKQTFYYGYFEARVLLPKGRGVWPAFWLNSDYDQDGNLSWPPEIDIFEYAVNGKEDTDNMVHSTGKLQKGSAFSILSHDKNYNLNWKSYVNDQPLNEAWHTFGLVWTPNKITVFLDGKPLYTQIYQWINKNGRLAAPAHILMNFAVGGQWAGRHGVDESSFPQALKVDHIRVCQYDKGPSGLDLCGGSKFTPDHSVYGYDSPINDLLKPVLHATTVVNVQNKGLKTNAQLEVSPGSKVSILNDVALPDNFPVRDLTLSLIKGAEPSALFEANVSPISELRTPINQTVEFPIPSNASAGDYFLIASLSTVAPEKSKRTPIRCSNEIDQSVKSVFCKVAKIKITK